MHIGKGRVVEILLEGGSRYARIACADSLIPSPGQYLAGSPGSDSVLPVPIFYTDSAPQGFIAPAHESWQPGDVLPLRGPLGHGFSLPPSARKVGLVAFDDSPSRLRGLVRPALQQNASVVMLTNSNTDDLPDEVEVQPLSALGEILQWADFLALDAARDHVRELLEQMAARIPLYRLSEAQILVRAPMPCSGLAECAVCAVSTRSEWKMICRDGPVFDLKEL
jgi:dihydroorotate dehydrogenase electron transfer subunit